MSHLEEGLIHALLDGEIPSAELPPIQAHLAACADCRARLEEESRMQAEAGRLVELLEVPVRTSGSPAARFSSGAPRDWPRRFAWAATLILAVGLGYAVRGSRSDTSTITPATNTTAVASPQTAVAAEAAVPSPPAAKVLAGQPARDKPVQPRRANAAARDGRKESAPGQEEPKREARVAADAAAQSEGALGRVAPAAPAAPAEVATTTPKPAPLVTSPAPPGFSALRGGERRPRLDEIVAAGAPERSAAAKAAANPVPIEFPEAVRRLGGALRLIEGMVPIRLEAAGDDVRVVYLLEHGELVLAQRRTEGRVTFSLTATPRLPADSLERLRARVRE
jgi:hypothetical protein